MALVVAMSFVLVAPLARGEVRIGYGPASQIARAGDLRGRNRIGQCLPFARALQARLQAAGIRAKIITYAYEGGVAPGENPPGLPQSHAVVAYEEGGRTYIMDNQSWSPKWIRDATAVEMAQRFSGPGVAVLGAKVSAGRESSPRLCRQTIIQSPRNAWPHRPHRFISPPGNSPYVYSLSAPLFRAQPRLSPGNFAGTG